MPQWLLLLFNSFFSIAILYIDGFPTPWIILLSDVSPSGGLVSSLVHLSVAI